MIWASVCVVIVAVAGLCRIGIFRSGEGSLPRDFDFDIYKNRELNMRGLFDKTKWY
ncbi:hypothetical protein [Solidesulfovibrio sp.]|jgi:hypothetical protein|uniref:hypothetical protein n=1 Tax=Solidesulfovibrio sp. TaxID=2910990 RepID=UPI002B219207|nr:hypothetical protein [Solidesulfovibrio sp.]MEA5089802.1 hypothetical protein [Solidesulfovibrio sp.]